MCFFMSFMSAKLLFKLQSVHNDTYRFGLEATCNKTLDDVLIYRLTLG